LLKGCNDGLLIVYKNGIWLKTNKIEEFEGNKKLLIAQ
jgi:hypothetical protein